MLYYVECITFHAYRFPRERLRILKKAGGLFPPVSSSDECRFFRCPLSFCGTDINLSIINSEYILCTQLPSTIVELCAAADSHKQIM